jgi:hypothetical protein
VLLQEWPITANLFDGDTLAGPFPMLFAEDPDRAKQAMTDDPKLVFKDLSRIYKKFFVPENVTTREALSLVKKPR